MKKQHKISLTSAILMNINMMVGVGAFFGPQLMSQKAGAAGFLGWPLVSIIFLPIVISVARAAKIFPGAGSFYSYSKKTINQTAGFISGWFFFLGYAGVAALQIACLRNVVLQYITINPIMFNIIFTSILCFLAFFNLKIISIIQSSGTIFKLLPFILVLSTFIVYWNPNLHITMTDILKVPTIVPIALFGFWGFECCCTISHLIKGKSSNASKAVLIAFAITAVIYTFFHLGLLHIMGIDNLVTYGTNSVALFLNLSSTHLTNVINITIAGAIILAYANAIFSVLIANSSTLHAMADEHLLPFSNTLKWQSKSHRPWITVATHSILTFLLASITSNQFVLLSIGNLGVLSAFLLTLISLVIIQTKNKEYSKIIISILAFISWIILVYFSWLSTGNRNLERLIALMPLIISALIGFGMFIFKKNQLEKFNHKA